VTLLRRGRYANWLYVAIFVQVPPL
jgi:hypothetical protein